jgi:aldehyde:ferredoxin oxidoreductase
VEHGYRSGSAMGAPFGAKNLKALVVRGTKPVTVFNPEKILEINAREVPRLKEYKKNTYLQPGRAHGSTAMNYFDRNLGVIGNYEWSEISDWPEIEKLRGDPFVKEYLSNYTGCFGCPIACIGEYQVPEVGLTGVMRCYDYFWPWRTMVPDLKNAFEASIIASDYGLEKQDIAAMTSWLMQLYDKGIITAKDTDGIPMERGSGEAFIQTIHKVANREGFGDILADGPLRFAQKIGPEAERWLMHRRGLNARTIDMRVLPGYALGEAITPRGVSHKHSVHSVIHADWPKEEIEKAKARAKKAYGSEKVVIPWEYEGKPILLIEEETGRAFIDALGVCTYPVSLLPIESTTYDAVGIPPRPHTLEVELLSAATGIELNEAMVKTIGDRIINVERAFNVREGITRKDDTIPERWFTDPVPTGPHKGRKIDRDKLEKMKDEYYQLRGWDITTGLPTKETLEKLGLHDVVKNLAKYGKLPKPKVKKP